MTTPGESGPDPRRHRFALAAVIAAALTVSLGLSLAAVGFRSHPDTGVRGPRTQMGPNLGRLDAEINARIAEQNHETAVRSWEREHHEVPDPADPPPAWQLPAIDKVDRVVRQWLSGYLPYEVHEASRATTAVLAATSTPRLARSLLRHPPLVPPTQRRRPRAGRALQLVTTIARDGRRAHVYVEVSYGLDRVGLQLLLTRRGETWLVALLAG